MEHVRSYVMRRNTIVVALTTTYAMIGAAGSYSLARDAPFVVDHLGALIHGIGGGTLGAIVASLATESESFTSFTSGLKRFAAIAGVASVGAGSGALLGETVQTILGNTLYHSGQVVYNILK